MIEMVKSKVQIPTGSVVLIDKKDEATAVPHISQSQANRYLPKKPLSEKQKAHLEKLIEKNKQRWTSKKQDVVEAIPESIPEDLEIDVKPKRRNKRIEALSSVIPDEIPPGKIAAIVKPKRAYKKRVTIQPIPKEPVNEVVLESEEDDSPIGTPTIIIKRSAKPKPTKPTNSAKPVKPKKYYYESSETSAYGSEESESDSESSEEEYKQQKYIAKTKKRLESVAEINARLKALSLQRENKYYRTNQSIF